MAEDAAELVEVDYEQLPAVVDVRAAMEEDAPLLHAEAPTNIATDRSMEFGEVEAAFARADQTVHGSFSFPRYSSTPIETYGVVAHWEQDGTGEDRALAAAASLAPPAAAARGDRIDVPVPEGEPNETIEVSTEISPPPERTWELLADFMRMTRCMPGVELDREHGKDTYSGHVGVHVGPMRLSFAGAARVLERDGEQRRLRAVTAGRDVSGSGVAADVTVTAAAVRDGGGTSLRAEARLYLSGRAAQFGRSLAGDVSRGLFAEFGACVERTLTTGEESQPRQPSGLAVVRRWSPPGCGRCCGG